MLRRVRNASEGTLRSEISKEFSIDEWIEAVKFYRENSQVVKLYLNWVIKIFVFSYKFNSRIILL